MAILVIGTLDTKGVEVAFVRDLLHSAGLTEECHASREKPSRIRRGFPRERFLSFEPDEEQDQINDEHKHNRCFEPQHPAIGLVVLEQLVEVVQRLELFINGG